MIRFIVQAAGVCKDHLVLCSSLLQFITFCPCYRERTRIAVISVGDGLIALDFHKVR
jgi:hypothetical protein